MTQAKRFPPNDPREWLNRARSDLAKARVTRGAAIACADAVLRWASRLVEAGR